MSEPGPIETIAIKALLAERVRVLGRLDGAFKRLQFAQNQVVNETALTTEYLNDIDILNNAITLLGGVIPPDEDIPPGTPPDPPIPTPPGEGSEPAISTFLSDDVAAVDEIGTGAGTLTPDVPPETPPPDSGGDLDPPPQTLSLNVDDTVETGDSMG